MDYTEAQLSLTNTQFMAIYALLYNVSLGDRNIFESAISDLMVNMEKAGAEDYIRSMPWQMPKIKIEASDEDGIVISLV